MSDHDFLHAMMAHEHHDNTLQFKRTQREKKRKREEEAKKSANLKDSDPVVNKRSRRPPTKTTSENPKNHSTSRVIKFCQYCKDNNRKYWTHDTEECYFRKPNKESNAIESLQKEFNEVKSLLKNLKKNKDSDSDSDE